MRRLIFALGVALSATGCGTGNGNGDFEALPSAPPTEIANVSIDTDAQIAAAPGEGVGVFVEYQAGGGWRISTACDTAIPTSGGAVCQWDLVASINPSLDLLVADDSELDRDDSVLPVDNGAVRLLFSTGRETDAVVLSAPPGQTLSLDIILDGVYDASTVSWISGGRVETGASDPVDFTPTTP